MLGYGKLLCVIYLLQTPAQSACMEVLHVELKPARNSGGNSRDKFFFFNIMTKIVTGS